MSDVFTRRSFLALSSASLAIAEPFPFEHLPNGKGITNNLLTPNMKLKSVDIDSVRWTSGLWAERTQTCATATVQHIWHEMENVHFANFQRAVGDLPLSDHQGAGFTDGDLYKWLEAAVIAYGITRDSQLQSLINRVISTIERAQRPDGYIFTRLTIAQKSGHSKAHPFENALDFETYNCGHLMTAACLHYRVTGERSLLRVAVKLSDFLCTAFASATPDVARFDICPSHYMGIIEMYRTTGFQRYLDLGRELIDMRDLVEHGTDQNQERQPFREQTKAVGHAVRANYLYAGAADVYAETGDPRLLAALNAIWQDVVSHKLYITGATGALNTGTSPSTYGRAVTQEVVAKGEKSMTGTNAESSKDAVQVVSQAYGREYQLPNITSYNESCATVGAILWHWRMLQITGDVKYADLLESTLINGIFSALSIDGTKFFYANALRRSKYLPFPMRYPPERQQYFRSFCCPPNIARTVAETNSYAYCASGDIIWTVLYGASRWEGRLPNATKIVLTQKTDYPWSGGISISVETETPTEFTIMLRIPAWAEGASIQANEQEKLEPATYHPLRRKWKTGDTVELKLPMRVRLMEAHNLVEETRGQAAVLRGPVVYCLESTDTATNVEIADLYLPRSARFTPVPFKIGQLELTALEGDVLKQPHRDWGSDLYREVSTAEPERIRVRLIPYFCWDNRGFSEMSVWLPLER